MAHQLHSLHGAADPAGCAQADAIAAGQVAAERRASCQASDAAPVMRQAPSTADLIIAKGHRIRTDFRSMNPASSVQAENSAQIGFLHVQIRKLCDELAGKRTPRLDYDPDDLVGRIDDAVTVLAAAERAATGWSGRVDVLEARRLMTRAIEYLEDAE